MSFSDLLAGVDRSIETHLCDPYAVTPAGGGEVRIVPAWVETPSAAPASFGVPVGQAIVEVATSTHRLTKGDLFFPGVHVGGVFVPAAVGWRVTGAPIRIEAGAWQVANVEPYTVAP